MKFGAHSQMFLHDISEAPALPLARAAELGMNAIEINVGLPEDFPTAAVDSARRDTGLEVVLGVALPIQRNTISDDPAVRQAGIDHLRRCVDIAHELGARKICGGIHSANGTFVGRARTRAEWDRSVEALRIAADVATTADVLLTVEPVSRYSGYFLNTVDDAIALVEEVGSEHVRLQLDTWHMNIEETDTVDAFRRAGGLIGHVHAVENNRGIPGTGHVPWVEVFRALDEIGYDDLVVYEHFPLDLPLMAVRTHTWRDLGSSEAVCVEGTRNLKRMMAQAREVVA